MNWTVFSQICIILLFTTPAIRSGVVLCWLPALRLFANCIPAVPSLAAAAGMLVLAGKPAGYGRVSPSCGMPVRNRLRLNSEGWQVLAS